MRHAGAVLMYHRIAELSRDVHQLCTPPARFRAQLEQVAARFSVRPLLEVVERKEGVAITLDDGTVDALAAAEILDALGLPATFFVVSARLDERHEHWWDAHESVSGELRARLITADGATRATLLDERAAPPPRETHRCLLGDEVRALAGRHAIGAHGVDHLHLPSLSEEAQRRELGECKRALEARLARAVDALAYPYGAYDERAVAVARELGFRWAVTVEERAVRAGDDRLRVPRIDAQRLEAGALIDRLEEILR